MPGNENAPHASSHRCRSSESWRPLRRQDLVDQAAGEETLLYDPTADAVHVLNPTAQAIWDLCDGRHTLADIETELRGRFASTSGRKLADDVSAAVASLGREGLFNSWHHAHDQEGMDEDTAGD